MKYPITGNFTSKKGTRWNYIVFIDGTIEQWKSNIVRGKVGYKTKDIYIKPTKECKAIIENKYGIICK